MTIGFTTPANAKASAEHIARKLKGFPEGFHDKWSEADRNAHYAAQYPHIAATRLAKANINRTPNSDLGGDRPPSVPEAIGFPEEVGSPQMDVRPYELPGGRGCAVQREIQARSPGAI